MYFGRQQWGYFSAPNGYWDIDGEPYTVAEGNQFRWFRSRILGGRTNHYGRISLRFSDYDFKPYSTTASAIDWPITYDEIVALLRQGRRLHRRHRHQGRHPQRARRQFPAADRRRACTKSLIQKACKKLNIPCIPSRMAMLTKPLNGRAACHYCGQCGRGCQHGVDLLVQPGA